jgi:hypothetical protein
MQMQLTPASSLDFDWLTKIKPNFDWVLLQMSHTTQYYNAANPYLQPGFWLADTIKSWFAAVAVDETHHSSYWTAHPSPVWILIGWHNVSLDFDWVLLL